MRAGEGASPRMPHHGRIARLPSNPTDLQRDDPDHYFRIYRECGGHPAPCRVDEHALILSLALLRRPQ